jgi:hypothetical protein
MKLKMKLFLFGLFAATFFTAQPSATFAAGSNYTYTYPSSYSPYLEHSDKKGNVDILASDAKGVWHLMQVGTTGKTTWDVNTGLKGFAALEIGVDGNLYFENATTLYAYSSTGNKLWTKKVTNMAAYTSGRLGIVSVSNSVVNSYDAKGNVIYSVKLDKDTGYMPDRGNGFWNTWTRTSRTFYKDGTKLFSLPIPEGFSIGSVAMSKDEKTFYLKTNTKTLEGTSSLSAYDAKGKRLWTTKAPLNGTSIGNVFVLPSGTIVYTYDYSLVGLDKNGKQLWTFTDKTFTSDIYDYSIMQNRIYFGSNIVNGDTGKLIKSINVPGSDSYLVAGDGALIHFTKNGFMRATS